MEHKAICRKSHFSLDDSPSWEGYTFGQTWNGFACPYFEHKVAVEILKDTTKANNQPEWAENKYGWNYNPQTDTFTIIDPNDEGDHYKITGEDIAVDGKIVKVYGIGNFAWVWSEDVNEMICDYCNDEIAEGANYIEAKPLNRGGAIATFCCSDCAGAFFVEKMCASKVNQGGN
jgi:hypothetical protein